MNISAPVGRAGRSFRCCFSDLRTNRLSWWIWHQGMMVMQLDSSEHLFQGIGTHIRYGSSSNENVTDVVSVSTRLYYA
eukprot:scaffold4634_cov122-Cylindrotheca_fusiformis.AAC.4